MVWRGPEGTGKVDIPSTAVAPSSVIIDVCDGMSRPPKQPATTCPVRTHASNGFGTRPADQAFSRCAMTAPRPHSCPSGPLLGTLAPRVRPHTTTATPCERLTITARCNASDVGLDVRQWLQTCFSEP